MKKTDVEMDEYIELLNNGYIPKKNDPKTKFSNGVTINRFWPYYKDRIYDKFNSDTKYKIGYEQAKATLEKLKIQTPSNLLFEIKVRDYINLLNNGYLPKHCDLETKFTTGETINYFWTSQKDRIIAALDNDPQYQTGYETAKEIINQLEDKQVKDIIFDQKVDEYIELLNQGYIPRYKEQNIKFKNGDLISTFWSKRNRDKIYAEFNSNPKYKIGYDKAKETLETLKTKDMSVLFFETKVNDYINLLNNGYIPKYCDLETKFTNGDFIGYFWTTHRDRVIIALDNDPKYQVGYEKAKAIIEELKTRKANAILLEAKIEKYIELLNNGYMIKGIDFKTELINGKAINYFWRNNKDKIIDKLNNDPKYQVGYETAKEAISPNRQGEYKTTNKTEKIAKDQILKYLGIELKKETDNSIKSIIKGECFKQNVSKQHKWMNEPYRKTLKKLDKLDTLDEAKIADIITHEIIENCLEKEEREEFKKAIFAYLQKVKELQKLDIAFENNNYIKKQKIRKYQFDEFDIEECVLISLEFNQSKLIEPKTDLYNRRKLISSCIIDWNELTTLEKEAIIKQNNFTLEEIALINEKQQEIKTLKKMR